jgi:capsular polysaccharide biosynthesis protein
MPRLARLIIGLVFLLVAGGLVVASILLNFILPDRFASTALILTGAQDPTLLGTQLGELNSTKTLEQVITNLHLNKKWAERYKEESDFTTEQTLGILRTQTKISQSKGTYLIQITVTDDDRLEAANIANEIVGVYRTSSFAAKSPPVQILETAQPSFRPQRKVNPLAFLWGLIIGGFGVFLLVSAARSPRSTPRALKIVKNKNALA